jgi:hypothetical protein
MKVAIKGFFLSFLSIGTCIFCIRQSFRAALGALALLAVALFLSHNSWLILVALGLTLALFSLWFLHIVVFATRATYRASTALQGPPEISPDSRRKLLTNFGKLAFGAGALSVVSAVVPNSALAQACNGQPCGTSCCIIGVQRCCYDNYGNGLCWNPQFNCPGGWH